MKKLGPREPVRAASRDRGESGVRVQLSPRRPVGHEMSGAGVTSDEAPRRHQAEQRARADRSDGRPMDPATRAQMESSFGEQLDAVRVHDDVGAATLARDLGANAFTVGSHIYFGDGRYRPHDGEGRRLLGHEIAHTVQQRGGVTAQAERPVHDHDPLEREADRAGEAAQSGREARVDGVTTPAPLQREPAKDGPNVSTAALLELSKARLADVGKSGANGAEMAAKVLVDEIDRRLGKTPGDVAAIENERKAATRLNDYLAGNQGTFKSLGEMEKPVNYLPGVAADIVAKVKTVSGAFSAALLFSFRTDEDAEAKFDPLKENADKLMMALPGQIVDATLGPKGLPAMLAEIRPGIAKLGELRGVVGAAPLRGRPAESIIMMDGPSTAPDLQKILEGVFAGMKKNRDAGKNVAETLQTLTLLTKQAHGLIQAMQVYEQLAAYEKGLDVWLNTWILETFGKEILGTIRSYKAKVNTAIEAFEKDRTLLKLGPLTASEQNVADGLNQLAAVLSSKDFQEAVAVAEERLKTIAVIKMVGKMIAITALAALGGVVAAEYAGAAAVSLGAAKGGFVAGAAAFTAEVLAFTAVSRLGQQAMFGTVDGSFAGDVFKNALMFGVLKIAQAGFGAAFKIFADPKKWEVTFAVGKAATGLVSLQLFAEAEYMLKNNGKLMPGEERLRSVIQNVVMIVALEAGSFIMKPVAERLTAPALKLKFGAEMSKLQVSAAELGKRVEAARRGELSPEEALQLVKDIQAQWVKELKLLDDAAQNKAISEAEMKEALAKYQNAAARMQLQLSKVNVEPPATPGTAMFKPLANGAVSFSLKGDAIQILRDFYKENKGTLEPSKTVKDAYEGRLPNGELTFYFPEEATPKSVPSAERLATARDDAQTAAAGDEVAQAGLARLQEIFGDANVDEILASVPKEQLPQFLRLLADPVLTKGVGTAASAAFFRQLAATPEAITFGRRHGFRVMQILAKRFGWTPELKQVLSTLETRAQADPEGTKALLDKIADADTAEQIETLMGKEKPVKPRKKPIRVTKKALPEVERGEEWETLRTEEANAAERRGETLTDEQLDVRADLESVFEAAKRGRFKRLGEANKRKILDAFDDVAAKAKMPTWWINSHRGILNEALFSPGFGKPKPVFLDGKLVTGKTPSGATIPDYSLPSGANTEWVNMKSDVIGTEADAKSAASAEMGRAAKEAANLPPGDKYSLDFTRTAPPKAIQAMLKILFAAGSPISRVKIGGVWYTSAAVK